MNRRARTFLLIGLLAAFLASSGVWAKRSGSPTLVVVFVVDQLGAGMLEPLRPHLEGGFKRFLEQGRRFTECRHAHALTETGPGHATLLSGLHPSHNGIIMNEWYDRDAREKVNCASAAKAGGDAKPNFDGSSGASASQLRGQNLSDLIKRTDSRSRVYAVGGKDRSAILTAGHSPDGAFWFSRRTGGFTSNPGIIAALPAWGEEFWRSDAASGPLYVDQVPDVWSYPLRRIARADDYPYESPALSRVAPHPLAGYKEKDPSAVGYLVESSPWQDHLTLQLAGRILHEEKLGSDAAVDLLVVALSATDYIGHRYGPGSQEHADQLLRLDRWLGDLMSQAEAAAGEQGAVLFALSADHGVLPLPELVPGARRIDEESFDRRLKDRLEKRLGRADLIEASHTGHLYLDRRAIEQGGLKLEKVIEETRRELSGFWEVARVFRASDFSSAPGDDLFLDLYRNSFDPARGGDLVLMPCEKCLITSSAEGTSHGTPYDYDRRVPMILLGPGIKRGEDGGECRTVDLAPTLASLMRLTFDSPRDGRPLPVGARRSGR